VKELEGCNQWKLQVLKLDRNPLSSSTKEEIARYSKNCEEDEYRRLGPHLILSRIISNIQLFIERLGSFLNGASPLSGLMSELCAEGGLFDMLAIHVFPPLHLAYAVNVILLLTKLCPLISMTFLSQCYGKLVYVFYTSSRCFSPSVLFPSYL